MNRFQENNENVYFGPIWTLLGQTRIFPKNPFRSLLSLYSPLTSCKKSEKTNDSILRNYRKSLFLGILGPFCPFFGQMGIFAKKWLHHLKRAMVFCLYAKNYKKRQNSSKDIVVWKIVRSDWSRAFEPKSREPDFSRTWGFREKLDNNMTLRFRLFPANSLGSIFCKSPKTLFLGPNSQIWGEPDFSRKIGLCQFWALMDP